MACIILRPQTQAWKKNCFIIIQLIFYSQRCSHTEGNLSRLHFTSILCFSVDQNPSVYREVPGAYREPGVRVGGRTSHLIVVPSGAHLQSPLDTDEPPPSPCSWLLRFPCTGPTASSACLPPSQPLWPSTSVLTPRHVAVCSWGCLRLSCLQLQPLPAISPPPAELDVGCHMGWPNSLRMGE